MKAVRGRDMSKLFHGHEWFHYEYTSCYGYNCCFKSTVLEIGSIWLLRYWGWIVRYIRTIHLIQWQGCDNNLHIKQVILGSRQLDSTTNATAEYVSWFTPAMSQHTEVQMNIAGRGKQQFQMHLRRFRQKNEIFLWIISLESNSQCTSTDWSNGLALTRRLNSSPYSATPG